MIYILIAVALMAALTFAVAQSDRTTLSNLTKDKLKLYASDIIEYGDTIKKAAIQIRLRGALATEISFAHTNADPAYGTYDNDPDNEIFNPEGGAIIYKTPDALALTNSSTKFQFYGENEVEEVGSTCNAAECTDLLFVVPNLKESVCIEINNTLGIGDKNDPPPTDGGLDITEFAGAYNYGATIGDEAGSSDLKGKTAGCFYDGAAGEYVYYQVLIAR